jgi:hypothetical protein
MTKKVLIAIGLAIALFSVAAHAAAVKATLAGVKGTVFVQPAGGTFAPAKDGTAVSEGASIKTGPDGETVVQWGDGNTMKLSALTLTKVDALSVDGKGVSKSNFSLGQGRVISRVSKLTKDSSFTVKTPVAVAGVRGTAFDCEINPITNQTQVAVVEGSVTLSAGGVDVVVNEGFESAVAEGDVPSAPAAIPEVKMQQLKTTVGELKQMSEASAAGEAAPATTAAAAVESAVETVQDNIVETNTIQKGIIEGLTGGCPGGGGCIRGTIDF